MASVSNGKRHVVKRKQTREKVCGLCLNANSCNTQNQNKYFGNSQSFPPPPPFFSTEFSPLYMCCNIHHFGIIKAKSYGIKTTSYAHKTTSYAHKTTTYAYKTTSYARKTTSYAHKTGLCKERKPKSGTETTETGNECLISRINFNFCQFYAGN